MFASPNHANARMTDYHTQCHGQVNEFVHRCLSREERLVIMLYYAESLSMDEIAVVLTLTVARVREIYEDVVMRTRDKVATILKEQGRLVA